MKIRICFLVRELGDPQEDMLGTEFYDGSQDNVGYFGLDNPEGPEGIKGTAKSSPNPAPKDSEVPTDEEIAKEEDVPTSFPGLHRRENHLMVSGEANNIKKHWEPSKNSARSVPSSAWEDILRTITMSDPKRSIARWMVKGLKSGREMHCVVLRSFEWSTWAPCSRSCGGGLRSRGRDRATHRELENEICNNFSCPKTRNPPPCEDTGCRKAFKGWGKCVHLKGNFLEGMEKFDPNVTPLYGICSSACDCACMKLKDEQNATSATTMATTMQTSTKLFPAASTTITATTAKTTTTTKTTTTATTIKIKTTTSKTTKTTTTKTTKATTTKTTKAQQQQ